LEASAQAAPAILFSASIFAGNAPNLLTWAKPAIKPTASAISTVMMVDALLPFNAANPATAPIGGVPLN
jgi:hypothetical protein